MSKTTEPNLKELIKSEFAKCAKDHIHIAKRYTKIQHPKKGKILFNLFPFQESTLQQFYKHRLNLIVKSRQMGISTLVAFFALVQMLFNDDFKVIVICTNQNTAKNLVQKVQIMHANFPVWLRKPVVENNKLGLKFGNGSEIKAISSSGNAARSEACSLLIIDEMAFVEGIDEIWSAAQLTLATGGSAILLSTPNGVGNLFHQMCARAIEGKSEGDSLGKFNLISLPWQLHPERDQKWRDEQTVLLGPRIAAQETDCSFETSGHTVMEAEFIKLYKEQCKDPIHTSGPGGDYWHWKFPNYGTDYLITADVARGDGADYSAFEVYDIEKNEQVAEFVGKISTRDFGRMLVAAGHEWNRALLVPDNKNVGWDTIQEIIDMEYPNLYYSSDNDPYMDPEKHIKKNYDLKMKEDMVPGFTTTTRTRPVMISKIETYYNVDQSPIRYSIRLINQYDVFIWKDAKAQAQYGFNDDLVMCDAMALYMRDTTLKMRQKGMELTKKAIDHFGQSKPIHIKSYQGANPWQMQTGTNTIDLKWLL